MPFTLSSTGTTSVTIVGSPAPPGAMGGTAGPKNLIIDSLTWSLRTGATAISTVSSVVEVRTDGTMRFRFYIPTIAANNAGGGTMSWPGGLNVGTFGAGFQFLLVGEADTANTALTAVFHHDY